MKKVLLFSLAVALTPVARLTADEGRIPIFRPTTITQPGHYILTRDIASTSGAAIVIDATDVTLDLNGRVISSSDLTNPVIHLGDTMKSAAVTIRGGRLSGGALSIFSFAQPGLRLRVERVEMEGAAYRAIGVDPVASMQMIGCRVAGTLGATTIHVSGPPAGTFTGQFVDNLITDVRGTGLELLNLRGGLLRGNIVTNFGMGNAFATGILIDATTAPTVDLGGTVLDGNVVRQSDDDIGIIVRAGSNNLLTNNVVTSLGSTGIIVQSGGNRLADNISSRNGGDGVRIGCATCAADHNVLERNTFRGNALYGVGVEGNANLIDGNVIEGNRIGIVFDSGTGSAYRGNMLRDNTVGPVAGPATDAGGNIL